jgi:RNA polymerase sigma-70 factor (ECF subfamily)
MTELDNTSEPDRQIRDCLGHLRVGDPVAREQLLAVACDRMRHIAHRMLPRFPTVRRWDQTDDVVQNAALRLCRALDDVQPGTPREFLGLAALQIRRELLDLAKKHARAGSLAANHETNCRRLDGEAIMKVDDAASPKDGVEASARWTRLHEAAESLPDDERELFHLAWYMGLTQEEASRLLGCSIRTVKRRWESAKSLIAAALDGDMPE